MGCSIRSRVAVTLAALVVMLGATVPLAAQATGTVRGQVIEAGSLRPLAGVQVSVPGTSRGTLTNARGEYLLAGVPTGSQTVRAQIIGYTNGEQTVAVAEGQSVRADFQLAESAVALDEIVVTGTAGAVSRRTIGNAITKLDAAEVANKTTVSNVTELLQAKTPGVTLLANAGTPGAASEIRIRGASSFIGNQPVVYVDGIRINTESLGNFAPSGAGTTSFSAQSTSALNLINPQDIESIEVIKGPAAATLYGAEAAGGVIQIITKKGALGAQPLRFDLRVEQGVSDWDVGIPTNFTVCNAAKIAERDRAGVPVWPGCQGVSPGTILTDNPLRRDPVALRTGDIQRVSISARGGGEQFSYYVSATNDSEEGVFLNSYNDTRTLRANFNVSPTEKLDFQITSSYTNGDLRLPLGDESAQGLLLSAVRGRPGRVPPGNDPERAGYATVSASQANAYNNTTDSDRFTLGTTLNVQPLAWFRNRLTLGLDYTSGLAQIISPPGSTDAQFASAPEGIVAQRYPRNFNYTVDYTGNVDAGLSENLRSTTSFGVQAISKRYQALFASGRGFGAPDVTLIGTAQVTAGSDAFEESRSLGYFVQEQLGWNNRLFVTGAVRADDHSAFGENFNLIFYPKASLSWILSEEPAVQPWFDAARVNDFKFRAAYGHAGRAPDPFSATQIYTVDKVVVGEEIRSALRARAYGNPDLRAERGEEIEIGFDAGLFNDRVGVDFTYYNKQMRDVIISSGVPGSTGFGSTFYGGTLSQLRNLGETLNTGIELGINATPVQTPVLAWESRLTLATNDNELVSFGDNRTSLTPFAPYGSVQQHRPGYPLAGYWAQLPKRNADGTPVVNERGVVQLDTSTFLGPSIPTREIGFSNTFTLFRDFRLYALFDYKGGHYLFNYKEYNRCRFNSNCERLADPSNVDLTTGQALNPEVAVWTQSVPGAWIEKADFVKLRDLSLTYSLPGGFARRLRADAASITLAGHNLALWSDYSGIDPEVNSYGNRSFVRADIYAAPMIRRLTASINLSF